MVADPWFQRIGSHVSVTSNLKHALPSSKNQPETIGILSFEVANLMSKTLRLHSSLTDSHISTLKTQILTSPGIQILVSSDHTYLLDLALSEKLQDLDFIATVVSRLGNKCTLPQLQGFQHVYADILTGAIDATELGFRVKDMDAMVRKMERFVNSTASLYGEMEVLNQLEVTTKRFQQNHHEESRKVFQQKLIWQIEDVRHLRDVSLWNQTYDKIVEILARTVCTLYTRISLVFVDSIDRRDMFSKTSGLGLAKKSDQISGSSNSSLVDIVRPTRKGEMNLLKAEDFKFSCAFGPGRLLEECLTMSTSVSKPDHRNDGSVPELDDRSSHVSGCTSVSSSIKKETMNHSNFHTRVPLSVDQKRSKGNLIKSSRTVPQTKLTVRTPPTTVGGSALALHYANVVVVIQKLLYYPHLVGKEARNDLRLGLKRSLKPYAKDLAIYDAPLAHDWKDRLDGILASLAPMAHNMIRWQSVRNFEEWHIVSRTDVLLLQTLYFADREKTEAAIIELLVGLNYICRYEHQQIALLDCASSFDFEDCTEWQLQY